jgi:hypothetical protein
MIALEIEKRIGKTQAQLFSLIGPSEPYQLPHGQPCKVLRVLPGHYTATGQSIAVLGYGRNFFFLPYLHPFHVHPSRGFSHKGSNAEYASERPSTPTIGITGHVLGSEGIDGKRERECKVM